MFKKIAFAGAGVLLLASPLLVSAQTADSVQAKIAALLAQVQELQQILVQLQSGLGTSDTQNSSGTSAGTSGCIVITHSMGVDDADATTGGDVTRLQQFLRSQYNNFPAATGFFGPITEAAVRQWQSEHGIVSSGTPDTTGYGYVGPRTIAAIKLTCGGSTTNTGGSYSLTIADVTGNAAVLQASIFPSGASCQANYSIDFGDGSTPVSKTASEAGCNSMLRAWPSHTYPTLSTAHTYTAKLMTGTTQLATKAVTIAGVTNTGAPAVTLTTNNHDSSGGTVTFSASDYITNVWTTTNADSVTGKYTSTGCTNTAYNATNAPWPPGGTGTNLSLNGTSGGGASPWANCTTVITVTAKNTTTNTTQSASVTNYVTPPTTTGTATVTGSVSGSTVTAIYTNLPAGSYIQLIDQSNNSAYGTVVTNISGSNSVTASSVAAGTYKLRVKQSISGGVDPTVAESAIFTVSVASNTTVLSQPNMHGYVCSTDNTQVTLAWDSVSNAGGNATAYALRVDDPALSCTGPLVGSTGNTGCVTDSTGSTEYVRGNPGSDTSTWATVNITPNTNYKWWVHAYNANGWSAYTKVPFSCSSTNTGGSYSLTIADVTGNAAVLQASIFPSGASCQANYSIDFGDGSTPVSKTASESGCNSMLRAWPSHTYPTLSTSHTYTAKLMTGTTQLATKAVTIAASTAQTCTPLSAQTQTVTCPSGQTGSITQTRTSSCTTGAATPTWSSWTDTSNTCTVATVAPTCTIASSADYVKTGTTVTFTVTKQNATGATFNAAGGTVAWGTDESKTVIYNTTGGKDVSWSLTGAGGTGSCSKHVDITTDTSASSGTNPYTPGGLTASCSGTQATLRWNAVSGAYPATSYALRVNDTTNDASGCSAPTVSGTGGTCYSPTDYINDNATIGTTVTVPAGKAISWWVHAVNGSGWSGATTGSFTCGTAASTATLSQLASALDAIESILKAYFSR